MDKDHEEARIKTECWPVAPSRTQLTCLLMMLLFESLCPKLVFVGSGCGTLMAASHSQEAS